MFRQDKHDSTLLDISLRAATVVLAMLTLLWLTTFTSQLCQAQTYSVLYNFTGGEDGATPKAGVTLDQAGNLYGTTAKGASFAGDCNVIGGCGTVYELKHESSGRIFSPLYTFQFSDGASPSARVVFGPGGLLYGTTTYGGNTQRDCLPTGCGTVFSLRPPASVCKSVLCPWTEAALYQFNGSEGGEPGYGDVIFDLNNNLYGINPVSAWGQAYELVPSGNSWTLNLLYDFIPPPSPCFASPAAGAIFGPDGNLYGASQIGGTYNGGAVYELTPSSPQWTITDLHDNMGGSDGGVIFDSAGNLYGTTLSGGDYGGGTVYELSPSNGGWTYSTLYNFSGGGGSYAVLIMDGAGNLYGTTILDGAYQQGNVFELTPSNGQWTYTSLHDFTGGSDGGQPFGQVNLDVNGNLYGTASIGGANDEGVVWEITP